MTRVCINAATKPPKQRTMTVATAPVAVLFSTCGREPCTVEDESVSDMNTSLGYAHYICKLHMANALGYIGHNRQVCG